MPIVFSQVDHPIPRFSRTQVKKWIIETITTHGKTTGNIQFYFCSDDYLLSINKKYLNHDYYTDVITFDYSQDHLIEGEIFISCERIKENAKSLSVHYVTETCRVIIHGILHMLGYQDHNQTEKEKMRYMEDKLLGEL